MKSPIYKKFQQLKTNLAEGDLRSAELCLRDLHKEELTTAALALFNSLFQAFTLASGVKIQFESPATLSELEPERPSGMLSSYDDRPLLDGISLVSCCMNRNDNLKQSLKSWLRLPVQEIVVVDWNSSTPVASTIADITDERIKVVRVENETRWILTYAFNVGLRFASYKKVYKLDADIETREDFLELNRFERGEFIRGSWESAIEADRVDQVYINGSYGCYKSDLLEAGLYNEHIRTYGWDDSDLYTRLSTKCGLKQKFFAFNSLTHSHQQAEDRLKHQDVTRDVFINHYPATEFSNSCNKFTIALFDQWWPSFLQDYSISNAGHNIWTCKRTTGHRTIPESVRKDARRYAVLENLFRAEPSWAEIVYAAPWMAEFIYEQYAAGIPFQETASVLRLQDSADGYYGIGTSPYAVLKHSDQDHADKQKANIQRLYVFEGTNARYELIFSKQKIVVQGLESSHFQTVSDSRKNPRQKKLYSVADLVSLPENLEGDLLSERVLAVSLYDERNKERAGEYLECLQRNLQHFDAVAIFYEQSNGEMYKQVNKLITTLGKSRKAAVIWLTIRTRPTFKEIFDSVDFIFPHAIVVTANADIAFDETINKISPVVIQDSFFVLSRHEIPECTGGNGGMIMNHFGLPNTWSADAWIYMTPRKVDFRADFPVGTFHCDSFLNYYIGKSDYKLYNPCLSVNAFHIHHEAFNSSEFKRLELADSIAESLSRETEHSEGEEPIRGIQWCRLKDVVHSERANQMISWSNFIINIFVDADGKNLVSSLIIAAMSLKLAGHIEGSISVSLNIATEFIDTELGDLLFDALQAFNNRSLNIAITNASDERPFVDGPETCYKAAVEIKSLLRTYQASFSQSNEASLFETDINFAEVDGRRVIAFPPHISIYFADDQSGDLTTYLLLKSLESEDFELVQKVLRTLGEKHPALRPYADELRLAGQDREGSATNRIVNELWGTPPAGPKAPYEITFITSMFKGAGFFRGFLENIAAAAIECNGEVILVDAASPENENEIFTRFIEEYPGLKNRFRYISLEDDPGLYNCWKLAIEHSSSEFVSNANLDDRRSPFQATALLEVLRSNPELNGAATAVRATQAINASWYSLTDNEHWFADEDSDRIDFESLYLRNDNNQICSKNMLHCMPVWKTLLHRKYGFFNEERYGTSADWAFWLKCTKNGEQFRLLPAILSMYFINQSSHNRIHDVKGRKELTIIKDFLSNEQHSFTQQ